MTVRKGKGKLVAGVLLLALILAAVAWWIVSMPTKTDKKKADKPSGLAGALGAAGEAVEQAKDALSGGLDAVTGAWDKTKDFVMDTAAEYTIDLGGATAEIES